MIYKLPCKLPGELNGVISDKYNREQVVSNSAEKPVRLVGLITSAVLLGLLAACGGGGGSDPDPSLVDSTTQGGSDTAQVTSMTDSNMLGQPMTADTSESELLSMVGGVDQIGGNATNMQQAEDQGDLLPFIYESEIGIDPAFAIAGADLVERLNASLLLPRDVPVHFADCPANIGANAFYISAGELISLPNGPNIVICNQLTALFVQFFNGSADQAFLASAFVLVHELGHALIDQLNLPIVGLEEATADAIAAVFAGEGGLAEASILAGFFFQNQESPWFDSHRAGAQRFGDLACYALGAEPQLANDANLMSIADQLGESRDCVREYQQQVNGLTVILGSNIRGGLGDAFMSIDGDSLNIGVEAPADTGNTSEFGPFWQVPTDNGDVFYVFIDAEAGDVAFGVDFQGDSFNQGESCYSVFPLTIPVTSFSVAQDGTLLLDGQPAAVPIAANEIPNHPICDDMNPNASVLGGIASESGS